MKPLDWLIVGAVVAYAIFTLVWLRARRKKGKHLCGGDCSQCAGCCNKRK